MKLVTHPCIINCVFFLQLVDNALADITEGSDIVGKYFEVDHDLVPYSSVVKDLTIFLSGVEKEHLFVFPPLNH